MHTSHARAGRRVLAALVIGSLGAALVAPSAAAAAPSAAAAAPYAGPSADQRVKQGQLGWGFKQSFRDYVEGPIADGGIEVYEPAVRLDDGTFRWTKARGKVDTVADTAGLRFEGEVYFYGHDTGSGPALEIWLDQPRLQLAGESGVVVADVTSRSMSDGELTFYDDVELAELDLTGMDLTESRKGIVKLVDIPSSLTDEGAEAFAGFYTGGTALDPVSFKVQLR